MKTILLDRDGVLNPYMPGDYVKSPSEWRWQENALDALQKLSKHNYQIIIITNQSCINRKIISYQTVLAIHAKIKAHLLEVGVSNLHFAICHHVSEDNCNCRKPKAQNLINIINTYQLDKNSTLFIGDSPSDLQAGKNAGIQTIALNTGNKNMELYLKETNTDYFKTLASAINVILK